MRAELTPEQYNALAILRDMFNESPSGPETTNCKSMNQMTSYPAGSVTESRQSTRRCQVHKIRNDEWLTQ